MKISVNAFSLATLCCFLISMNISAQEWLQLNDPPFYTDHSNGFGHNGKAYIMQGGGSDNVWEYDPTADSWTQLDDFPGQARSIAIGDYWDGKYYWGFGVDGSYFADLWVFDPEDKSFTELPSCPGTPRSHPAFVAVNDKIFMGSGTSANGDLDDWWEYDILAETWRQLPDMPGNRRHHPFMFHIDGNIYVGGGHRLNWLEWNPTTETWREINDFPQGRVAGTQFSYENYGYVLAGDDRFHVNIPKENTFLRYDAQEDEWEVLPPLPNGSRWAPSSFLIENELYYFGGYNDLVQDRTMWKFDMNYFECVPATGVRTMMVDTTSASLFWQSNTSSIADTLKWRELGSDIWNVVVDPQVLFVLEGLDACTEYEYVVVTTCSDRVSQTTPLTFSTEGCCTNPNLEVESIAMSAATISWDEVDETDDYLIRWKSEADTEWTELSATGGSLELDQLESCTAYNVQVQSICSGVSNTFSEELRIVTAGCENCEMLTYCAPGGNLTMQDDNFIQSVRIGSYFNETGFNGGFGEYQIPSNQGIVIGETYDVELELSEAIQRLTVWVDWNANGLFENTERVYRRNAARGSASFTMSVPDDAVLTAIKMRVFYASANSNLVSCYPEGDPVFGDVEDYCMQVQLETSIKEIDGNQAVQISPNPFGDYMELQHSLSPTGKLSAVVYNQAGQITLTVENVQNNKIPTSNLPSGLYVVQVSNGVDVAQVKAIKI